MLIPLGSCRRQLGQRLNLLRSDMKARIAAIVAGNYGVGPQLLLAISNVTPLTFAMLVATYNPLLTDGLTWRHLGAVAGWNQPRRIGRMSDSDLIDRTSFDVLMELSKDARISNKVLAAKLGLAPSTTHYRLKQLRATGVYEGAHAEVQLRKLGYGIKALLQISLARQDPERVASFLDELKGLVEARQFLIITGQFDLIVEVAVKDTDHLRDLEFGLTANPIVERIETAVIFEGWRQYTLPIPAWIEEPVAVLSKTGRRAT